MDAIEAALVVKDYKTALNQADALETFTAPEPLPLSMLIIERARLLAGMRGAAASTDESIERRRNLLARLRKIQWTRAIPALESGA
jgi:hypothetical protein